MASDNMAMQIFIARDGEQIGSWMEDEVLHYYEAGQLLPTDHYWREGMSDWQRLENLTPTPAPSVPPAEPIADIQPNLPIQPVRIPEPVRPIEPVRAIEPVRSEIKRKPPSPLIWALPLAGAIILGAVLVVVMIRRHQAAERIVDEINAFAAQQRQEAEKQIAKKGYVQPDQKKTDAEMTKLKSLSQDEGGPEKKLTDAALDVMQQINSRVQACQAVEQQMLALGLSPTKITSLDELEKRRTAVQACQPPIQDLLTYLKNIDAHSHDFLTAQGVPQAQIDGFISGMDRTAKAQQLITYWQLESTILSDISVNLDLFKTNWGKWNLTDHTVVFEDSGALAAYNANQKKIQDDVAQQKTAQQQVLSATPAH